MNLSELDQKIKEAEKRWENTIPRGEAIDIAIDAVMDKLLAIKDKITTREMESQKQADKEQIEILEGVIDILNQVKFENVEAG